MHRCLTGAVGDVEFEFVVEMNLVQIGTKENSSCPSRGDSFPPVLVMEAAENHASHNLAALGKGMFVVILQRWEYRGTFRNPRSESVHLVHFKRARSGMKDASGFRPVNLVENIFVRHAPIEAECASAVNDLLESLLGQSLAERLKVEALRVSGSDCDRW